MFLEPDLSLFLEFELLELRLFVGLGFLLFLDCEFVKLLDLGGGFKVESFVVFLRDRLLSLKLSIEFGTLVARVTMLVTLIIHILKWKKQITASL